MELTKKQKSEVLGLYEKYAKILELNLNDLPILTLTQTEYKMACVTEKRFKSAKKYFNSAYGFYNYKQEQYNHITHKQEQYNHIIHLNTEKFKGLYGLHEKSDWSNWQSVTLRSGRITQRKYRTIEPHLEETLIHELIHAKYSTKLKHGKRFNSIVEQTFIRGQLEL